MDARDFLIMLDLEKDHDWEEVYRAIKNKDFPKDGRLVRDIKLNAILADGYKVCTIVDPEYPNEIKTRIIKPPFVIYYKGKVEDIWEKYQSYTYDRQKGCFLD